MMFTAKKFLISSCRKSAAFVVVMTMFTFVSIKYSGNVYRWTESRNFLNDVLLNRITLKEITEGVNQRETIDELFAKHLLTNSSLNITVVTAYFNIGNFQKGAKEKNTIFKPDRYLKWMETFARILNPVVAYVDTQEAYEVFTNLRKSKKNITRVILVNKAHMWSFKLRDRIASIYSKPNYPKHHPNTVLPEYSCAMHAKYEVLNASINANFFNTPYFIWLDIGLFRDAINNKNDFGLQIPDTFNDSKIAFSEVFRFEPFYSMENIVYGNLVWIGGASCLGRFDVMRKFVNQYRRFVDIFLEKNLMDTDQQVIYAMYIMSSKNYKPEVQLQVYKSGWFHLGYLCKASWVKNSIVKRAIGLS